MHTFLSSFASEITLGDRNLVKEVVLIPGLTTYQKTEMHVGQYQQ